MTPPNWIRPLPARLCAGELFFHRSSRLRLPTFDAKARSAPIRPIWRSTSPSVAAGDATRQPLVAALANRDFTLLAEGAELLPLADSAGYARALRLFQDLPIDGAEVRTERRQPVTLRAYREAASTTICLINESPWPVVVTLPMQSEESVAWTQLGVTPEVVIAEAQADSATGGMRPAGDEPWSVTLPPYGVDARRYASRTLRVGTMNLEISDEARAAGRKSGGGRAADAKSRRGAREYHQLQNPGFELLGPNDRMMGWTQRGEGGVVELDATTFYAGNHALHLAESPLRAWRCRANYFPFRRPASWPFVPWCAPTAPSLKANSLRGWSTTSAARRGAVRFRQVVLRWARVD